MHWEGLFYLPYRDPELSASIAMAVEPLHINCATGKLNMPVSQVPNQTNWRNAQQQAQAAQVRHEFNFRRQRLPNGRKVIRPLLISFRC